MQNVKGLTTAISAGTGKKSQMHWSAVLINRILEARNVQKSEENKRFSWIHG